MFPFYSKMLTPYTYFWIANLTVSALWLATMIPTRFSDPGIFLYSLILCIHSDKHLWYCSVVAS